MTTTQPAERPGPVRGPRHDRWWCPGPYGCLLRPRRRGSAYDGGGAASAPFAPWLTADGRVPFQVLSYLRDKDIPPLSGVDRWHHQNVRGRFLSVFYGERMLEKLHHLGPGGSREHLRENLRDLSLRCPPDWINAVVGGDASGLARTQQAFRSSAPLVRSTLGGTGIRRLSVETPPLPLHGPATTRLDPTFWDAVWDLLVSCPVRELVIQGGGAPRDGWLGHLTTIDGGGRFGEAALVRALDHADTAQRLRRLVVRRRVDVSVSDDAPHPPWLSASTRLVPHHGLVQTHRSPFPSLSFVVYAIFLLSKPHFLFCFGWCP